jgi:DNA-binding XRE family transcriptional regulator
MPWLTPAQSQAARALLNWFQKDLAQRAGLGETTVREFEDGARTPMARTLFALWAAFTRAGVRFPPDGVLLTEHKLPPLCAVDLAPAALCGWYMEQSGYGLLDNPFTQDTHEARVWVDGYVQSMQDQRTAGEFVPVEQLIEEYEADPVKRQHLKEARQRLAPLLASPGEPRYERMMRGEGPHRDSLE